MGAYNFLLENNSYFANFVSNSFAINHDDGENNENEASTNSELN